MPPQGPPTVRLNGDAIRRVREAKGLTQLYVAEVVGVTVDTVSRWENNRTSAVKRENATALAGALEVELPEILREAEAEPPAASAMEAQALVPPAPAPSVSRHARRLAAASALAVLLAAGWWAWRHPWGSDDFSVEAQRRLPAYSPPGSVLPVVLSLRILSGSGGRVVLREALPGGWTVVSATIPPDSGPEPDGLVRWIVNASAPQTRIAYLVRVPAGVSLGTRFDFRGVVVPPGREGHEVDVEGDTQTDAEQVHWADKNGDFSVSDAELLEALDRIEAAKTLGLTGDEVRSLWGAGAYGWDPASKSFRPRPGAAQTP